MESKRFYLNGNLNSASYFNNNNKLQKRGQLLPGATSYKWLQILSEQASQSNILAGERFGLGLGLQGSRCRQVENHQSTCVNKEKKKKKKSKRQVEISHDQPAK